MTAWPPTTRYLTAYFAKAANRSLKCQGLSAIGASRVCLQNHLPGRVEDRLRTLALPVSNVKRTPGFGDRHKSCHHKRRIRTVLLGHAYTILADRKYWHLALFIRHLATPVWKSRIYISGVCVN